MGPLVGGEAQAQFNWGRTLEYMIKDVQHNRTIEWNRVVRVRVELLVDDGGEGKLVRLERIASGYLEWSGRNYLKRQEAGDIDIKGGTGG